MTSRELRRLSLRFKRDLGLSEDGSVYITNSGKGPLARVHARTSVDAVMIDLESGVGYRNRGVQVRTVDPPRAWPSVLLGEYAMTLEALRRAVVLHDVMAS